MDGLSLSVICTRIQAIEMEEEKNAVERCLEIINEGALIS
jgi:hypothetical protein